MATPTYELIDSTVLGSSSASVTFSSIPADYRDLVLVAEPEATTASAEEIRIELVINSDTGSNYSYVRMGGDGSSASSSSGTLSWVLFNGFLADGERGIRIAQLMDYSATDKHTTLLVRDSSTDVGRVEATAVRWANTSAVTSVEVRTRSGNYAAGSTFYLYGISA
jgi:hypothetical protein